MKINAKNRFRIIMICCLLFVGGVVRETVQAQEASSGKTKASVTFYYSDQAPNLPEPDIPKKPSPPIDQRKSGILPQTGESKIKVTLLSLLGVVSLLIIFIVRKKTRHNYK